MTSLAHNSALPQAAADAAKSAADELYLRALDLLAEGRERDAATLLQESIALDPLFLDARHGLIRALQDAGDLDEAVAVSHQLIALDGDDVLAHTRLSILYQAKGLVEEAEREATRAKLLGWKQQLREGRAELGSGAKPV